MELWDVYEINRNKTNKTMVRGEPFEKNNYHLVVHVCVFNSNGEMLIQQRQPFKEGWSNMWDITVGGSAIKGDTSQSAAERELFEEIGLTVDFKNIRPHITINFNNGFDDVYLIEQEVDINELSLQYEEVQNVKWASKEEIFSLIENGEFIPYYQSLIQLFFDMRKKYGCTKQSDHTVVANSNQILRCKRCFDIGYAGGIVPVLAQPEKLCLNMVLYKGCK